MPSYSRRVLTAVLTISMLSLAMLAAGPVRAATSVECGQLTGYTAPDPVAPTDGALSIGLLDPWPIAPGASVSAEAAAGLPALVNSSPVCLTVERSGDDNRITALGFAANGTITGPVTQETIGDVGFYILADRLPVPDFILSGFPGLWALFITSHQAGVSPTLTLFTDPATGMFTGVDGTTGFCGLARVNHDGDGVVGAAIIPAEVLDPEDLAALATAGSLETCASIRVLAVQGDEDLSVDTLVTITTAAPGLTLPVTNTAPTAVATTATPDGTSAWIAIFAAISLGAAVRAARWQAARGRCATR